MAKTRFSAILKRSADVLKDSPTYTSLTLAADIKLNCDKLGTLWTHQLFLEWFPGIQVSPNQNVMQLASTVRSGGSTVVYVAIRWQPRVFTSLFV